MKENFNLSKHFCQVDGLKRVDLKDFSQQKSRHLSGMRLAREY
jgi:hypothetical protein